MSSHIAMFPWFAMGHLTPFTHLSNNLAKKGHRISFLVPKNTQYKIEAFNLHPQLISFVPITIPHVDGLPPDAETTSDVPFELFPLIMTAMDKTQSQVEILLRDLKVDIVLYDFAHWIPVVARGLGIKSLHYSIITPVTVGYALAPTRRGQGNQGPSESELMEPPDGFPASYIKLHIHEARDFTNRTNMKFGSDMSFFDRLYMSLSECDALAFSGSEEYEGPFCDFLQRQFGKPVLLSGPAIPNSPNSTLDENMVKWLGRFKTSSVIYCALGSECTLKKDQFQELLLGLELTGMPFLAALRPPVGIMSVEEAIPQGLVERLDGRGLVYGGWVQQQLILENPSIGCFVTHCGWASLSEAMVNKCQMVLLPHAGDQIIHARIMSTCYKVGVEVEKGEVDGLFTRDSVCKAVRSAMDEGSEIGKEIRANHDKLREFLLKKDLKSSYNDRFCDKLKSLLA